MAKDIKKKEIFKEEIEEEIEKPIEKKWYVTKSCKVVHDSILVDLQKDRLVSGSLLENLKKNGLAEAR